MFCILDILREWLQLKKNVKFHTFKLELTNVFFSIENFPYLDGVGFNQYVNHQNNEESTQSITPTNNC